MELLASVVQQGIIQLYGIVFRKDTVKIYYNALPGSHPNAMGYFVAIWPGMHVQSLSKALRIREIESSQLGGSINFEDLLLGDQDYTIGFGVDNAVRNSICATVYVPTDATVGLQLQSSLSSVLVPEMGIGSSSLIATYMSPAHNQPALNHNWMALFRGPMGAGCYEGANVITTARAITNMPTGSILINNVPSGFKRFEIYTIVYGVAVDHADFPIYKNIICFYTFSIEARGLNICSGPPLRPSQLNSPLPRVSDTHKILTQSTCNQ